MGDKYHVGGAVKPLPKTKIRVGVSTTGSVRWEFDGMRRGLEFSDEEFRAIVAHTIRMLEDVRGRKLVAVGALPKTETPSGT